MKITLTKELCPVHYKRKTSGWCNPCSAGWQGCTKYRMMVTRKSWLVKMVFLQLHQEAVWVAEHFSLHAWGCAFICVSFRKPQMQTFSSNKCAMPSPQIQCQCWKIHSSKFIVKYGIAKSRMAWDLRSFLLYVNTLWTLLWEKACECLWWIHESCLYRNLRASLNVVNAFKPTRYRRAKFSTSQIYHFSQGCEWIAPWLVLPSKEVFSQLQTLEFKIYHNWLHHSPGHHPNQADCMWCCWNKSWSRCWMTGAHTGAYAVSQSDSQLLQPLPYSPSPGRKWDCKLVGYITPWLAPLWCLLYP